jgi:hypothetical protein
LKWNSSALFEKTSTGRIEMNKTPAKKKASAEKPIKSIIDFLKKNLKDFPADTAVFKQMLVEAGVTEGTFTNLTQGTNSPKKKGCTALAKVFQEYDPRIKDYWFRARTFEAFLEYYNNTEMPELVSFEVHNLKERKKQIETGLPGLYVTYRHSFDSDVPNSIAREVLLVNSDLSFRMSFWPTFANGDEKPEFFNGKIIPVGESIVFVGLSNVTATSLPDRGRVIFCHADNLHRECRFGMISSTRLHHERSPCAACIFFVRVTAEIGDKELENFYEKSTRIGPFNEIIAADFGNEAEDYLEIFLDNSPIGTPRKKKKLQRLEGEQSSPEQILRLNLGRFNREMPQIIKRVLDDKAIRAPFKSGW